MSEELKQRIKFLEASVEELFNRAEQAEQEWVEARVAHAHEKQQKHAVEAQLAAVQEREAALVEALRKIAEGEHPEEHEDVASEALTVAEQRRERLDDSQGEKPHQWLCDLTHPGEDCPADEQAQGEKYEIQPGS